MSRSGPCATDIIVPNRGKHRATVVMLHGMYGSPFHLSDLASHMSVIGCRCVLMSAPRRTIHWPTGLEYDVSSWYDYYTRKDGEEEHDIINQRHLESQAYRVQDTLKRELPKCSSGKMFVLGSSQGATVVMHCCALGLLGMVSGVISLRGCFLHNLVKSPSVKNINLLIFSGSDDQVYSLSLQKVAFGALEEYGANVQWVIKQGLQHQSTSTTECKACRDFISRLTV